MGRAAGIALVIALGLGAACSGGADGSSSTTTTGRPQPLPTLGRTGPFPAGIGFGRAKPTEISLGGDPTGILSRITWHSWGGSRATGSGTGT
jgi:hypothetical protein